MSCRLSSCSLTAAVAWLRDDGNRNYVSAGAWPDTASANGDETSSSPRDGAAPIDVGDPMRAILMTLVSAVVMAIVGSGSRARNTAELSGELSAGDLVAAGDVLLAVAARPQPAPPSGSAAPAAKEYRDGCP